MQRRGDQSRTSRRSSWARPIKNKGVQPLLDAVVRYLPSPLERAVEGQEPEGSDARRSSSKPDPTKPFVGMAFKIVDDPFGQLTFMRIYQGTIEKGETYYNQRTGKKERFSRIVRMHADKREEIDAAEAGDIVADHGHRLRQRRYVRREPKYCTLESMFVAEPVIKMAINPVSARRRRQAGQGPAALPQGRPDVPRLHRRRDRRNGDRRHGRVAPGNLRRADPPRVRVEVEVGAPKVSYREAPTQAAEFDYKHKKQTGGSGQYAHIVGTLEPLPTKTPNRERSMFEDKVVGGRIPKRIHPGGREGLPRLARQGPGRRLSRSSASRSILEDGSYHDVDSSDMAFQICAQDCFRETFLKTKPVLLEPIMKVEIEVPRAVPRPGGRRPDQPPRHDRGDRDEGRRSPTIEGRSAAGRDLRLLDRPAQHDAGSGHLHDGVRQVPPRAGQHPGRNHRRTQGANCSRRRETAVSFWPSAISEDNSAPGSAGGFCCAFFVNHLADRARRCLARRRAFELLRDLQQVGVDLAERGAARAS